MYNVMCLCKHTAFLVHAINDAIKQKTEALSCAEAAAVSWLDVVRGCCGWESSPGSFSSFFLHLGVSSLLCLSTLGSVDSEFLFTALTGCEPGEGRQKVSRGFWPSCKCYREFPSGFWLQLKSSLEPHRVVGEGDSLRLRPAGEHAAPSMRWADRPSAAQDLNASLSMGRSLKVLNVDL